jgi:anti-sigma factor RsiW
MSPRPPNDLACKELVELVTEYLEQTLSFEERTRFEHHLTLCRGCKEYLRQMRSTIDISRRLAEDALPLKVQDELLAVFRRWKAG